MRRDLQAGQRARAARHVAAELVDAGAQRISVGGGLAWAAVNGLAAAAQGLREEGGFDALAAPASLSDWLGG